MRLLAGNRYLFHVGEQFELSSEAFPKSHFDQASLALPCREDLHHELGREVSAVERIPGLLLSLAIAPRHDAPPLQPFHRPPQPAGVGRHQT